MRRIARVFLEPLAKVFRKFFDPRFYKIEIQLDQTAEGLGEGLGEVSQEIRHQGVVASTRDAAVRDGITLTNARISRLEHEIGKLGEEIGTLGETVRQQAANQLSQQSYLEDTQSKLEDLLRQQAANQATQRMYLQDSQTNLEDVRTNVAAIRPLIESLPRVLDPPTETDRVSPIDADLLNYAESHLGFRSQEGLWFNPPDVVRYKEGRVELSAITERSIEVPFVISTVAAQVPSGASVLDVGCAESLVPLELAALGFSVTGIDLRPYPLSHPNLKTVATPLEDWRSRKKFDVIVCLSSIEHFGLGAYGDDEVDLELDVKTMEALRKRVNPDGLLVMTIPFGEPTVTPVQRMYDFDRLEELLQGWRIDSLQIAVPANDGWVIASDLPDPAPPHTPPITVQVALLTAHPDV